MAWAPLRQGTSEDALNYFLGMVWLLLCTHIPYEEIHTKKSSHPWLNNKCEDAIRAKNAAEGTSGFASARNECSTILASEYQAYLGRLKTKIANLPKGSKEWWRLKRELLNKCSKLSGIPPLKSGSEWITDSKGKANLLAETMAAKNELPPEAVDCPFFGHADYEFDEFIALRTRKTCSLMQKLDENKATGPDRIPAKIIKRLAKFLAQPFTVICRRLLAEGCWPKV